MRLQFPTSYAVGAWFFISPEWFHADQCDSPLCAAGGIRTPKSRRRRIYSPLSQPIAQLRHDSCVRPEGFEPPTFLGKWFTATLLQPICIQTLVVSYRTDLDAPTFAEGGTL